MNNLISRAELLKSLTKSRDDYMREHFVCDPSTGAYEASEAKEEYLSYLNENIEFVESFQSPDFASDGLPYGIIDQDYARFFTDARLACWGYGYALAMHGSFTRDLDLIAMPWTNSACEAEKLIQQIEYRTEWKRQKREPSQREHGRMVWTLTSPKFECARFVDFSVVPTSPSPLSMEPQS